MKQVLGESVVSAFIADRKLEADEEIGKLILIEPREWLDYAVTSVTHDGENGYRAIYDLDLLESLHAMMWTYQEKNYKFTGIKNLYLDCSYMRSEADEWVSYNTLRGAEYEGPSRPLFVRTGIKNRFQGLLASI